jgi:hypothetical protein
MLTNGPVIEAGDIVAKGQIFASAWAIPVSPNITIIVVQVIITNFFIVFSPQKTLSNNIHPAANNRQQD